MTFTYVTLLPFSTSRYYFTLRYVTLWIQLRLPLRQTDNISLYYAPPDALHSIPLGRVTVRYVTLHYPYVTLRYAFRSTRVCL